MDEPPAETERDDELDTLKADAPGGEAPMDGEPGEDSNTEIKADYVGLNTGEVPVPQPEKTGTEDEIDALKSQGIEIEGAIKLPLDTTSIVLNDRFDIHQSRPLHNLDSPSAHAFEAESLTSQGVDVFALVCIPDLAVRADVIEKLVGNSIPNCLDLMDYGAAYWPPLERKTFILIFEKPLGGRVSDVLKEETSDYNKIDYIKSSLDAMIMGLDELHSRNIYHRAIRHDNLFFRDDKREEVVLGEFVSSPPGFDQPIAYETIERSMADEGGRGTGSAEDDMYACGVALAVLTQKSAPTQRPKENLITSKITDSSYQTLVGNDLITGTLLDVIRGLLNDDPSQRWGLEELESWKDGRRASPSQPSRPTKARKSLQIDGVDHIYLRTLAYAVAQRPSLALKLIKDGTIQQWVRQELKDEDLASIIEDLTLKAETNPERPETNDVLVAQTLICLDPQAPVRFKGVSFMPDAIGTAMMIERLRGGKLMPFAEAINFEIAKMWFEINSETSAARDMKAAGYFSMRAHLRDKNPGYGIERCLYEMNHGFPCQSLLLQGEFIINLEDILPALEETAKTVDPKTIPVDRHIAAFVASRVKNSVVPSLLDIANPDEAIKVLGQLKLLSFVQDLSDPQPFPALAKWIGSQIEPVIKLYQHRATREELSTEVPIRVQSGMLSDLLDLLDNRERRIEDEAGYERAISEFQSTQDEIAEIKSGIDPNSDKADQTAQQASAIASMAIMAFVVILMLFTA